MQTSTTPPRAPSPSWGGRLGALCAVGLLAWLVSGPAQAQVPDVDALRDRLERVRRGPGASLPTGAMDSIAYTIDVAERIAGKFGPQSENWRRRAARFLDLAEKGEDPIVAQRGKILMRGYRSPLSEVMQGYAIYIPEGYDPAKRYPLMIVLHGGSANGNLFLGVVLGNNMSWLKYPIHLWDDYEPRWRPDWIVVAPDGFGQVMWRWMGERDVLDVLDDVQKHYSVDPDRVVFGGLSNGGVGAYNIGMRHAWRFAAVTAMAGAPSWEQYGGGHMLEVEKRIIEPLSGLSLIENAFDTDLRYFHGRTDTGPMKPAYVEELDRRVAELGVPAKGTWYDTGHDILYLVHRHGQIYDQLADVRRDPRPKEVRVVTGDYRANRQHWITVTRIDRYPELARVRGVVDGSALKLETKNAVALSIDLRDCPLSGDRVRIEADDHEVYAGPRAPLGHVLHLARDAGGWRTGFLQEDPDALEKRPGSSGPIEDAYYEATLHVYGTGKPDDEAALKRAAERGSQGWPLWLWRYSQRVVADRDVTDAMMANNNLVLYATPGANSVLEKISGRLPIQITDDAVVAGTRRFDAKGVGAKFIHPNPLAPAHYVLVQGAPTAAAVAAGNKLPDFLPDYVIYDARSTAARTRLVFSRGAPPLAQGFFDRHWRLPEEAQGKGGDDTPLVPPKSTTAPPSPARTPDAGAPHAAATRDAGQSLLPVPPAPPTPERPAHFAAPRSSQAGQAARIIARRAHGFQNYRALTPGARWLVDPLARWSIRGNERCLRDLRDRGMRVRVWDPALSTPVPTPVELVGRVDGVWFRMTHEERTLLLSCEMVARLPTVVGVLKRHGVRGVDVMSAYRDKPRNSFHTMGLALDLLRFFTLDGVLSVLTDFEATPDERTCEGPMPQGKKARALRDIACRLADSKKFSTVLTPNYNEGHRDHFHVDIRPDDPRVFLR